RSGYHPPRLPVHRCSTAVRGRDQGLLQVLGILRVIGNPVACDAHRRRRCPPQVPGTSERAEKTSGSSRWRVAVAAIVSSALFLALTVPRMNWGPVIGTGQDAWYNVVRGLRTLYDHFNPGYFIHPALYYELLAVLYGLHGFALWASGSVGGGTGHLDYFL